MDGSSPQRNFDFDAALVVDSDRDHGQVVRACLEGCTLRGAVHVTSNVSGALSRLEGSKIDLVFIDTALPSDGAREIIEATFRLPSSPLLIAMGLTSDSASTTFALAKTGVHANSDAIWAPVPAEPGRLFRRTWARIPEHLGARSDASGHGFRSTWAPVPEHPGTGSGAPGQAFERVALGVVATA